MSHYTGPKNRLSRREGLDLYGKGNKLRRATQVPGQHGPKGGKRPTGFGTQLREKQKTRRIYGIIEKQFRKYFEMARKSKGATGEKLLQMLETRLDNTVYRLGFVPTRLMARQIVSHGHIRVNGKLVSVPSYQVKIGEIITLSDKISQNPTVQAKLSASDIILPAWLKRESAQGSVVAMPSRSDIDVPVSEQLIVEYYSR